MPISHLSNEQLHASLKALEQALYNHENWSEQLFATLVCRQPAHPDDLHPDAHRLCRFGQWYYATGNSDFQHHPGAGEIETKHEQMHQYAARMLRIAAQGEAIPLEEYHRFLNAMKNLRLEIATVQRDLGEALHHLDPLTGTPSRTGMLSKLREQHALATRKIQSCSVAMIDLDHFKSINDQYGHLVGDKVLASFARHVMSNLRPYDKIFRYGGEEFLICLPATDLETAYALTDRLRSGFADLPHEADGHDIFHVTVSFGLSLLDPQLSVESAIDRADKALYSAKRNGRNRTVVWDDTLALPAS